MSRLFESLTQNVRDMIEAGELVPGDKLPSEREMARQFQVARVVVREAFRSLEESGVIEFRRGARGGAFIRNGDGAAITRRIKDLMSLGTISLGDLLEARVCLLGFAAELACELGTEDDFALLDQNLDETLTHLDSSDEERVQSITRFYTLIGKASNNAVIYFLIESLTEVVAKILMAAHRRIVSADLVIQRRIIVERFRARDRKGACAEMSKHLRYLHSLANQQSMELYTLRGL